MHPQLYSLFDPFNEDFPLCYPKLKIDLAQIHDNQPLVDQRYRLIFSYTMPGRATESKA